MEIFETKKAIQIQILQLKAEGKSIGFVPTMGALHQGHLELVQRAVAENDCCIVSIFVNPTQFNNPTDLEKYPRTLEQDVVLLERVGCNYIFAPRPNEMYENTELYTSFEFDFGGLDMVMEGRFRPGHFNGVVQIVSKLFQLINPDKAYFGEKDFQQLSIIHRMVEVLNYKTLIIDCPIVREPSGLARSSRNERLSAQQRINAVEISKVLFESTTFTAQLTPKKLTAWVKTQLSQAEGLEVEYFDIVDVETLQPIENWSKPSVGCIAVFCGEVRLIDNIRYTKN
jgi:pantoate--beta-alanine ligase